MLYLVTLLAVLRQLGTWDFRFALPVLFCPVVLQDAGHRDLEV